MRKLRITLASLLATAVVAPAVYFFVERANENPSDADLIRMQGKWQLTSINDGDPVDHRHSLFAYIDVKGNSFEWPPRLADHADQHAEVTLNASKEPKHLDWTFEDNGLVTIHKALYRLERGRLSICRNWKDPTQRPEEFRADRETGVVIEIYERDDGWGSVELGGP